MFFINKTVKKVSYKNESNQPIDTRINLFFLKIHIIRKPHGIFSNEY